jgi:hypothetical protein
MSKSSAQEAPHLSRRVTGSSWLTQQGLAEAVCKNGSHSPTYRVNRTVPPGPFLRHVFRDRHSAAAAPAARDSQPEGGV